MYILAFNTATKAGSVAIAHEDQLIINYSLKSTVSHSKRLLSSIALVLKQVSLTLTDLSGFGVTIGPGSFTGLRIGLSVAKGLAYGAGKPLVCVSTLEAMAFGLPFVPYLICPVLDARKGEIYVGFFKNQNQTLLKILPEMVLPPQDLRQYIHDPVIFLGDDIGLYKDLLRQGLEEKAFFVAEGRSGSIAACVALLALEKIKKGQTEDIGSIKPRYIRRSEAEIKWGGVKNNSLVLG